MKKLKTSIVAVLFIFSSSAAFSQTSSIRDSAAQTQNDTNKAKNTNQTIGALNLGIGATCAATCAMAGTGCCSLAPIFLMMGMQNLSQAKADGQTAAQAGGTVGMTDIGMGANAGYDPAAVTALMRDPDVAAGMAFGTSHTDVDPATGMSFNSKANTVTTADGKVIKATDVASPAAMAASGMSQSMIDQVTAMEKKIEAKANAKLDKYGLNGKPVLGEEGGSGGGGGGSGGRGGSGAGTPDIAYGGARAPKLGINRDPAQVAGMQKDFNGEPIGVAGDSIFRMMTRRYKVKESQSSFLDEAAILQK
jgi:hypothetical protein